MATRRGNGEGSFFMRKDGRWEGQLRYTDSRGEPHRVSAYGATRKLAKAALDAKIERIRAGVAVVDSKSPLAAVAAKWRTTTLIASDLEQSTKDLYTSRCMLHIEKGVLADIPLARLTASDIEDWFIDSRKNDVSPSSLRTDYAVLRAILDTAVRDGVVAKNVAAQVRRPSVPRSEALHLEPAQVSDLLEKVSRSRHALPILLAAATGMRRGEVLAIRWRDINFVTGQVTVAGTLSGQGKKLWRKSSAKTDSSHRTLPIGVKLVAQLQARRDEQRAERRRAKNQWDDNNDGCVFTTEFGKLIDPRNMLRTLQKAAKELELPAGTSLHTLRHSAATSLLEDGAHIKLVSAILGHSDTAITADIYGHAPDAAQRVALDALHTKMTSSRHLHALPTVDPADENAG
ncbi:site-specific integrase [Mycobacteroides abscessus]|uniref:tyrosine-type recombinase/integrase n=1 Tax=Mycobacteroides abscessus TaxID=36809 RepID=UPI0034CD5BAA